MQLHSIRATNFLGLDDVTLEIDPAVTIVVGPNGAGKSSIARALQLAAAAVGTMGGGQERAVIERYLTAGNVRGDGGFEVSVEMTLTSEWERALAGSWVRAAVAASFEFAPSAVRTPALHEAIAGGLADDALSPLFTGTLLVRLSPGLSPVWDATWTFDYDGRPVDYAIAGAGAVNSLAVAGARTGGRVLVDQFATENARSFQFSFDRLVPKDGLVALTFTPGANSPFATALGKLTEVDPSGIQTYGFGWVLQRILSRQLAVAEGQRLPARTRYAVHELQVPPPLADAQAVPLELFRLKNGSSQQRDLFRRVQERFRQLTGRSFDITVRLSDSNTEMSIEPAVLDGGSAFPVAWAGAGLWEALVFSVLTTGDSGRVLVLDEPAVNMHPTLQRRIAGALPAADSQVLLITHSPFLVPVHSNADLLRIVRLDRTAGRSSVHRLTPTGTENTARWQKLLDQSTDVRSCLFASGVVLVEGDTELGALGMWLSSLDRSPEGLNIQLVAVGSDTAFKTYVEMLGAFGIPWVTVCDAPVLDTTRTRNIAEQLSIKPPDAALTGAELREAWAKHGVFSLVPDGPTGRPEGEVEQFFDSLDPSAWGRARQAGGRSKVLSGRAFASTVRIPPEVEAMWENALRILTLEDIGAP